MLDCILCLCNFLRHFLQLALLNRDTGVLTGESLFTLKCYYVADICDILLLRHNYDSVVQRLGDRFRSAIKTMVLGTSRCEPSFPRRPKNSRLCRPSDAYPTQTESGLLRGPTPTVLRREETRHPYAHAITQYHNRKMQKLSL